MNRETKQLLIDYLYEQPYIKKSGNCEYVIRCPFCGDSDKSNHGHFYIRINPDDNYHVVYFCFKCNSFGILTPDLLDLLDIHDPRLHSGVNIMNKTSVKFDSKNIQMEDRFTYFDRKLPEIFSRRKIDYIQRRLGRTFNLDELKEMKVVTSLYQFLNYNEIEKLTVNKYACDIIEKDYVGFLSFGNSHILFRDITDTHEITWIKYPITKDSQNNRLFYTTAMELNPMTSEPITVNLSEGVLDILSARYNLNYCGNNTLNIAVGGFYFNRILMFLLDMGVVGSNVTVNIFADNDERFNTKAKVKTNLQYFEKTLSKMKYLYGEVNIYYNIKSKDIGVPLDNIKLQKYRL